MCFGLVMLFFQACRPPQPGEPYEARKSLLADSMLVACAHPLAARVGVEVMEAGGNAVDAAVAVQFALAVVYPRAGNIGGGGFMVIRLADGTRAALDYREKAPGAAHRDMYLDSLGNPVPAWSREGHLAVGVPGTVAGMVAAHERFGS
ncbi:MAG: gamma-glutamyltransferase, partial [Bacteroidetes bacterium]